MLVPLEIRRAVAGTDTVQAFDLSFRLRAEAALALLDCEPGARVLDVGCGVGSFSALLAARSLRVACADISDENVATLRRRHPELSTVRGDVTALPFGTNAFDVAILMEVLEHVDDDHAALVEIRRVVRDRGLLILSVPNLAARPPVLERLPVDSVHTREGPEHHYRDGYDVRELSRLVRENGFEIETITSVGGPAYRLAASVVSVAHLIYRLARRQPSWTWADVEADRGRPLMRLYGAVFPVVLGFARLGAIRPDMRGATLLMKARAVPAVGNTPS